MGLESAEEVIEMNRRGEEEIEEWRRHLGSRSVASGAGGENESV